jgi:hypothetical protein
LLYPVEQVVQTVAEEHTSQPVGNFTHFPAIAWYPVAHLEQAEAAQVEQLASISEHFSQVLSVFNP